MSFSAKTDGKSHLCCLQKEGKDLAKDLRSRKQPPHGWVYQLGGRVSSDQEMGLEGAL